MPAAEAFAARLRPATVKLRFRRPARRPRLRPDPRNQERLEEINRRLEELSKLLVYVEKR